MGLYQHFLTQQILIHIHQFLYHLLLVIQLTTQIPLRLWHHITLKLSAKTVFSLWCTTKNTLMQLEPFLRQLPSFIRLSSMTAAILQTGSSSTRRTANLCSQRLDWTPEQCLHSDWTPTWAMEKQQSNRSTWQLMPALLD